MAKKITLIINDEEKTFSQPSRIKGRAARVGFKLAEKLENYDKGDTDYSMDDLLDEMLQYVAEYAYNNQFTAEELEDGLDARDLFPQLSQELASILKGDEPENANFTKAKKA